jgi:hypothetical protein
MVTVRMTAARGGWRMWFQGIDRISASLKTVGLSLMRIYNSRHFCLIDINTTI